eukprot:TRINITY_DN3464_c0_g1_i1.p1 TRINITY_DN3464_c0_g1~~TRINITY_DN3464_c0_g1_i1.p1  ORF type:complete len:270 (+),score=55.46 TRINITY_DN3464_c0_g1_i1:83-892(+)
MSQDSTMELKTSLREALVKDGSMVKMKAHMRERVLSILRNKTLDEGRPVYSETTETKEVKEKKEERRGYAVVADFLKNRNLDYSLSLLKGEAGMDNESVQLDIPEDALKRVTGGARSGSLLSNIIEDWIKLASSSQTPSVAPPIAQTAPPSPPKSEEGCSEGSVSSSVSYADNQGALSASESQDGFVVSAPGEKDPEEKTPDQGTFIQHQVEEDGRVIQSTIDSDDDMSSYEDDDEDDDDNIQKQTYEDEFSAADDGDDDDDVDDDDAF